MVHKNSNPIESVQIEYFIFSRFWSMMLKNTRAPIEGPSCAYEGSYNLGTRKGNSVRPMH